MSQRLSFRVGVFVPNEVQLLDLAAVDGMLPLIRSARSLCAKDKLNPDVASVIYMAGQAYLTALGPLVPAELLALAPDVAIVYISQKPAESLLRLTADSKIQITHHYSDAAVAPGTLNAVYIPGPAPTSRIEDGAKMWLVAQAGTAGVDIMSVCTGIFVLGQAGLLKGRTASGPRTMQELIRGMFEGVKTVGDEFRWTVDGNLWTSGKFAHVSSLPHSFPPL